MHPDLLVSTVAERQGGLVTRRQLTALQLGPAAVHRRMERGLLHRLHRGVYLWAQSSPEPPVRARAAVLACGDGAILSHLSAMAHWGMTPESEGPIDVTITGRRSRHPDIRTHNRRALDVRDIRTLNAVPTTSPARTLLDSASEMPSRDFARAVERAQIKRLITKHELKATIARAPRHPNAAALRAVVAEPAFTRSEAERRLLALLRSAKLPIPVFNAMVEGYEVDTLWREQRVILEFDSYAFHATRAAFERDRRKSAVLDRASYVVLRSTWNELTQDSYALIARVAEKLVLTALRAAA